MNMTTNSTAPQFTFTINDGIFIAIQGFTYFLMLLLLLLLFLFRKEKELKTRGSVPFFSVFGVFLLSIRLIAGNLSFLKITNSLSFSYKFSCWWSLIISAPVLTLFVVLQTLTTIQYFINKRIDSLKDLTWELYDTKNEKATKKMEKNSKKVQEVNSNSKTSSKRFSLRNINSKRLSVNLSSSKSELLSPNSKNARKSLGNTEIHNKSENPPRKVSKENSPRELSDIFSSENQTPNSDQEVTSNERVSMDLDTEDHKLLKNILFKMKIAKFLSSNILKIFLVLIVFLGVILFQAAINGVLEIVTSPNLCTFDKMLFSNGISSLATPIALILFTFIYFMCFIADIIIFTKQNGFKMKLYFTVDDPFGFRIEMFIDLIILTAGIFISFSTFIGNAIYQRIEIPGVYTVRGEIINIGTTIFLILAQWFVLFAMVGIPLLFAVISYIKRKFEPTIYETEFDAFINSKEGKAIFKKFAKKEWSLENILFYEEVEKYKKVWSMKFAKKRAEEILSNYIEVGSTLEINISGEVRKLTKKKIQNFKDYKDDYKNIFNESIKETKRNMRDTYARIRRTLEYSVWKTSSKVLVDETVI
eukprot:gene7279-11597_t